MSQLDLRILEGMAQIPKEGHMLGLLTKLRYV